MNDKDFDAFFDSVKKDLENSEDLSPIAQQKNDDSARQNRRKPSDGKKQVRKRKTVFILLFGIVLAALIIAAICFQAVRANEDDFPSNGLKGVWQLDEVTAYEFDGKGNGFLHTGINDFSFTYDLQDDMIQIDFESESATDSHYQYEIKGNVLTLTLGDKVYSLTKK